MCGHGLGVVRKFLKQGGASPHVIDFEVSNLIDPLLFKQLGDTMTANRKDWVKRNKKKKGKGGKGKGKKKK